MCIAVTRSYLVWFGIQIAQAMLAGWLGETASEEEFLH
jgi:hypothetical protein